MQQTGCGQGHLLYVQKLVKKYKKYFDYKIYGIIAVAETADVYTILY